MNQSDSERIAAYLEFYGFKPELNRAKAGLVILNTCGIRQKAEDRNYGLIPEIKADNPKAKIILTGCLSERKDVRRRLDGKVDIWLPIKDLPGLARKLRLKAEKFTKKDYLDIAPITGSEFSAYVPIGNGCDNFCSYCVVPYARGREVYRSAGAVITEVKRLIARDFREIVLIAQNVNSYRSIIAKKDLPYFPKKKIGEEVFFPELLAAAAKLSGDFWLRFFTSHPKNMCDELVTVMKNNKKICRQIHLPAQAGDDKIIAAMNRKYTVKHYLGLVKKLRQAMPEIGLSTDIIVGFPGETRVQFANTEKLLHQAKYDMIYLARFSPRPGTAAAKLKDNVTPKEKQRREEALNEILKKTAWKNNQRYLHKTIKVLVQEKNKRGEWLGKNEQFITVKIFNAAARDLQGSFAPVKITVAKDFGLEGILAG
jgi:tRNA-2-methylthio-N6-dimethylallyladenosine synthase